MGAALSYAENSTRNPLPPELEMLWLVDRFGWDAAHKAPAGEMRRMIAAENIYRACTGRQAATKQDGGWAAWEREHKQAAKLLSRATIARERYNGES